MTKKITVPKKRPGPKKTLEDATIRSIRIPDTLWDEIPQRDRSCWIRGAIAMRIVRDDMAK
jgi:hypothetical protein